MESPVPSTSHVQPIPEHSSQQMFWFPNELPHIDAARVPRHDAFTLPLRSSWKKYIHHNGGYYYYNERLRMTVENNIDDPRILHAVLEWRDDILRDLKYTGNYRQMSKKWDDWELGMVGTEEDEPSFYPDFVSYKKQVTFEFPDHSQKPKDNIIYGPKESFWDHLRRVPMHLEKIPPEIETEFLNAMAYGANEHIMGNQETNFPYTDLQIKRLVEIYQDLKGQQLAAGINGKFFVPALAWHIAECMYTVARRRDRYDYGTPNNATTMVTPVSDLTWKIRILDIILGILFLGTHAAYRKRLFNTRARGVTYISEYSSMMEHFLVEWSDSNLLAIVFASSNVAFLAVPDINTLQQTASLASSVLALMSIAAGVHHVWVHRGKVDVEDEEVIKYINHVRFLGDKLDLTVTACFLSLPIVSLLWSILSFTVAIGAFCFQDSDVHGKTLLGVILGTSVLFMFCMAFFFWHIWRVQPKKMLMDAINWRTQMWNWVRKKLESKDEKCIAENP